MDKGVELDFTGLSHLSCSYEATCLDTIEVYTSGNSITVFITTVPTHIVQARLRIYRYALMPTCTRSRDNV